MDARLLDSERPSVVPLSRSVLPLLQNKDEARFERDFELRIMLSEIDIPA